MRARWTSVDIDLSAVQDTSGSFEPFLGGRMKEFEAKGLTHTTTRSSISSEGG